MPPLLLKTTRPLSEAVPNSLIVYFKSERFRRAEQSGVHLKARDGLPRFGAAVAVDGNAIPSIPSAC